MPCRQAYTLGHKHTHDQSTGQIQKEKRKIQQMKQLKLQIDSKRVKWQRQTETEVAE